MKIAHIVTRGDDLGGAQVHVRDLAEAAILHGHDVTVLTGGNGSFTAELDARGIAYRPIPNLVQPIAPGKDVKALFEIIAALRAIQPDIVATHTAKAGLLGRLAARALARPAVFTPHGWSIADRISRSKGFVFRRIEALASLASSRIINVCNYEVELALKYGIAPRRKLAMVHNGLADIPEELRADATAGPPRIIMVARMAEPKDHAGLLSALSRLRHLDWTLDLVGDGPFKPDLHRRASEAGLLQRVRFIGYSEDVAHRLAGAQIFVLASRSEAFPYSILEAMRAGLPVVANRVGGVSEALVDGHSGLLAPAGDVQALAEHLGALIVDPAARKRLGDNGRQRFLANFTFEKMFSKTMVVYQEAVRIAAGVPQHAMD